MSFFEYQNIKIHFTRSGHGKTIVLLHGWGADLNTFKSLMGDLEKSYEVLAIDFPGFGQSEEPLTPWNLDDYTQMTQLLLEYLHIEFPVLIGHSFGGRVSIKLSQRIMVDKIILINSAGIKPPRTYSYYFKVYGYKCFKFIAQLPLLSYLLSEPLNAYRELHSSSDYKQASDTMKQVLSKVVNEDLKHLLPNIKCPVLLIWGDLDESTPLNDAKAMSQLIPDSGLVVFEGAGHFSYLEEPARTQTVVRTFIGGSK